jgi:cytoskeletal protein CcmA (bactofilin family)
MFSKNSKGKPANTPEPPKAPTKPAPPSLISRDLKIVGDLKSDGEIQIDGSVEGDIRSKTLLIGENAHIKGEITADSVIVHGTVNGQIKARSVKLAQSAHMVGDIMHEDLAIETGAFLEGHCRRMEEEKPARVAAVNDGSTAKDKPQEQAKAV